MGQPLARIDDKYEIVAKIQEGGMGEIYKVRHRLLDEIRVVKVLHPELVGDSELTERFAREARAAIRLRHPNIVQIFDFTLDESGTGLIVMEYIRGRDLKQLIRRPPLPSIPLTLEIARQALRALGYLHRSGFVHRDVSPDNLMLSSDVEGRPLVKVIDLGIAKRRGSDVQLTASGIFLGKFRYASPEHFGAQGTGGIEARSDLYTFGLVLYELLTGRYPIPGESMSQLIAGHLFQPPCDFSETDPGQRIPEALRRIVLKTLSKDPSERFASADELVARLEALQADHPLDEEVLEESRSLVAAAPAADIPAAGDPAIPGAEGEEPTGATAIGEAGDDAALETLVRQVEDLLESGQLTEADRILVQARESHGSADELTTARRRLAERRQHSATELEQRLLGMIRQRNFTGAKEALAAARAELGSDPTFEPLRRLLARTVAERIEELVQEAGVAFEAERFDDAAAHLGEALELDPDNTWIEGRLEQARAERRRREEEIRRRRERDAAADAYLGQAREARDGRDVLKARLLVAKALELRPDDAEARALGRSLDRQHRVAEMSSLKTAPLSPGLLQAFSDIEAKRAEGDTLAAWRRLRDAIDEYGEIDTFTKLRRQLAEEILNAGEETPVEE